MNIARVLSEAEVIKAEIRRKSQEIERLSEQLNRLADSAQGEGEPGGAGGAQHTPPRLPVDAAEDEVLPLAELERRYVLRVLDRFGGNRSQTARALQIGTNTLWRKLKAWGEPPARGA